MIGVIGIGYWGSKIVSTLKNKNLDVETMDINDDITKIKSKNVIISTPAHTHKEITKTMLELGKNVLVEKPAFMNMKECKEIETVLKKTKGKFMCGHLFVHNEHLDHIKDNVTNISHIECRRLNWGRVQKDISPILHLAPHDVSILDYLINQYPIKIQTTPYYIAKSNQPDYVTIDLQYKDTTAQIQLGWYYNEKVRHVKVFADDTVYDWKDEKNLTTRLENGKNKTVFNQGLPCLSISLKNFISYCEDDIEPITNFEHAKRITHTIEAIEKSMK
tara:strand:- start:619 stop:1443 length:825 start_codon:yes stop_codon:yes gene_type:complete